MNNTWFNISEVLPPVDAEILAELDGCKICKYLKMTVRYGEGFGHIKRWKYLQNEEKTDVKQLYKGEN